MELVPIIYNSLLVVFTLLALVIVGSLICSKLLFCGNNSSNRVKVRQSKLNKDRQSQTVKTDRREIVKKNEVVYRKSQPKIERKLIDNKKVKVISRAERRKRENSQNFAPNKFSRYSVLNTAPQERKSSKELFHKFSKMSIEYSQSA